MIDFLLHTIQNLNEVLVKSGLFFVFGNTAFRLRNRSELTTDSDMDCMLLLNGDFDIDVVVTTIILQLINEINKSKKLSQVPPIPPFSQLETIVEMSLKESAPEQIPVYDLIAQLLKIKGIPMNPPEKVAGPLKWKSDLLNILPFRIHILYENDGRYLIKLVGAHPIGKLEIPTASGLITVPRYKEYLDINVYRRDLPITERQAEYMRAFNASFLKIGPYDIPVECLGMFLCQQVDLFRSIYNTKVENLRREKRGQAPLPVRDISADRKASLRFLWNSLSLDQQERLKDLFSRPVNTYKNELNGKKEKTVIGEFLKEIGVAAEGGKRRQKKRRSTRKNL